VFGKLFLILKYNIKPAQICDKKQARKIPLKSVSNRGFMPSLKTHLHGRILSYESLLEHDFLLLLDHDPKLDGQLRSSVTCAVFFGGLVARSPFGSTPKKSQRVIWSLVEGGPLHLRA
jgi:hypothetical protein